MRDSKPWQAMQWVKSSSLPRASGSSFMPCHIEMSLQRTRPFCRAKSWVALCSAVRLTPLLLSALKPGALIAKRYSPAGRSARRYLPVLSESTLTVILVLALRACTKAPRNAAPSGPLTVPVMLAASARHVESANEPRIASAMFAAGRMAFPHVCCRGASLSAHAASCIQDNTRVTACPARGAARSEAERCTADAGPRLLSSGPKRKKPGFRVCNAPFASLMLRCARDMRSPHALTRAAAGIH